MAVFMNLILGILSFAFLCAANEYTLRVSKTLDWTDAPESDFIFNEVEGAINVKFEINATLTSVNETTVYLANKVKEILEVTFTEGNVAYKRHVTPYRLAEEQPEAVSDSKIHPDAVDFDIPIDYIPKNIIAVSASFLNYEADVSVIYNFYAIKNFDISIPDRLIVESFMPLSLPSTNEEEPPEEGTTEDSRMW